MLTEVKKYSISNAIVKNMAKNRSYKVADFCKDKMNLVNSKSFLVVNVSYGSYSRHPSHVMYY